MARREYTSKGRAEIVLDGVEFVAQASVFDIAEFHRFSEIDPDTPEGAAALAEIFTAILGEEQYPRFLAHCRKHGTDADTLLDILSDAIGDLAGGKAQAPSSDSSDGPPTTGRTLKVVSSSGVREVELPAERSAALAAAVARADQQRAAALALEALNAPAAATG